jgi:hypothetical protein
MIKYIFLPVKEKILPRLAAKGEIPAVLGKRFGVCAGFTKKGKSYEVSGRGPSRSSGLLR